MQRTSDSSQTTTSAPLNPEAFFDSPEAILQDGHLDTSQQVAALENWAFSVRARVDALSEGMVNHPEGAYTRDVDLLHRIETTLGKLKTPESATQK